MSSVTTFIIINTYSDMGQTAWQLVSSADTIAEAKEAINRDVDRSKGFYHIDDYDIYVRVARGDEIYGDAVA